MSTDLIFADAKTRTDTAIADSQSFLDRLDVIAKDDQISFDNNVSLVTHDTNMRGLVDITEPGLVVPTAPGLIALEESLASTELDKLSLDYYAHTLPDIWEADTLDEFTEKAPELDAPDKPLDAAPTAPAAYVGDNLDALALAPFVIDETLSPAVLTEVTLIEPGALEIASVDLSVPTLDLIAPASTFEFVEEDYSSPMLTSLQNLISSDIENGGYGIEPSDEQALYARGRDREAEQVAVAVTQARKGIAARGFPVPPGALYETERVILQKGHIALSELNREIVLKRSDLYVQARQFAVQQGIGLEQALFNYVGAQQERALKVQQVTADLAIQFHNAAVQLFEVKIKIKQLYRDLHSEQLKTAVTKIQEYGEFLSHADMQNKINQTRLQQFNNKKEAQQLFYSAQKARDDHTRIQVEMEQLKLAAYQSKVEIFSTEVKARAAEFDVYRVAWEGEGMKQKVFAQQVEAHSAQVDVATKKAQMDEDVFNGEMKLLEAERSRSTVRIEQYNAEIRKAVAKLELDKDTNQDTLTTWASDRAVERANINAAYTRDVEHANKILEAAKYNLDLSTTSVAGIVSMKELNSTAAQAALLTYTEAIKAAEGSLSAIEARIT